jgi:hypothetical protein
VGAGLFAQSLRTIYSLDLGIEPEQVLVIEPQLPGLGGLPPDAATAERARRAGVLSDAVATLASRPDVQSASVAVGLPFGNSFGVPLAAPGRDSLPALPGGGPFISAVGPDYFVTVGTPIRSGRAFTPSDSPLSEPVAIVNETMAAALWPGETALGKCLFIGTDSRGCATVVGIAGDAKQSGLRDEPSLQYYVPFGQERGFGGAVLLLRPAANAGDEMMESVRLSVPQLVPEARRVSVRRLQDIIEPQLRPWKLGAGMFGLFALIATGVAAVGLYTALAYSATRREREMAIRRALGAPSSEIVFRMVSSALVAVSLGLGIGFVVALLASKRLEPLLFETSARDPLVYLSAGLLLLLVTGIAAIAPVRRGTVVSPQVLLRSE